MQRGTTKKEEKQGDVKAVSGVLLTPDVLTELNYHIGELPTKFGIHLVGLLQRIPMQEWVPAGEAKQ